MPDRPANAARETSRRLYVYNGGFLTQPRLRRILNLAGWEVRVGLPDSSATSSDHVGVWGQSPTSPRGEAVAARRDAPILRVEDAWLRSVHPGRTGGGPGLGLLLDRQGPHFDGRAPSDLETLLGTDPLDDTALLDRARDGIARLKAEHLTKYSGVDPGAPVPEPGYVLVIDQTEGDASVRACGANRNRFLEMLTYARQEHPGARILIKTHPETAAGARSGHYRDADATGPVTLHDEPASPWALLDGAIAVYVVSSQMGFEAILAGHRPVVFGQPFYAGWGLTEDRMPVDRRQRRLTRAQLFAGAMLRYPVWYDPFRDRLTGFETACDILGAETRAWREDRAGWVATGIRLWKRRPLAQVYGRAGRIRYLDPPERALAQVAQGHQQDESDARLAADPDPRAPHRTDSTPPPVPRLMVWAGKTTDALDAAGAVRVEDGFLRSRGLGAALIPPLSLVADDLGIYYDPTRESRLERLVLQTAASGLRADQRRRAEALRAALISAGVTKYNLGGAGLPPDLPAGRRLLVPGQVEDDASIRLGAQGVATNRDLLLAARAAHPDAVILYKPHPDVEAGLRTGAVPEAADIADVVLDHTDPVAALAGVDAVWTMTSALGFEALLRDVPVTCLGTPFYAGWGLTEDLGAVPARRRVGPRPDLPTLIHAALIAYPRYHDPVSNRPCPPEVALERLQSGTLPRPGLPLRLLAKAQGLFASQAWLWRR